MRCVHCGQEVVSLLTVIQTTDEGEMTHKRGCRICMAGDLHTRTPPHPGMTSRTGTISAAHRQDIVSRRRAPDGSIVRDTGRRSIGMGGTR